MNSSNEIYWNSPESIPPAPTAVSDSIRAYRKYGVLRSLVHYQMINHFHYAPRFRDTLKTYFILHWNADFTKDQISDGIISLASGDYTVIWYKLSPYDLHNQKNLRLSFREAQPEYNLPAYVLITTMKF